MPALPSSFRWILFVLFIASGSCGLIYEVVWSRMLTLTFGATTLAISTVLATFMADLAANHFRKAISIRFDFSPAHYNLGHLYLKYYRAFHLAIREFQEAQKVDPQNARIWNALGMAHALLGEDSKARDCWQRALELDPTYKEAKRNLNRLGYIIRREK